MTASLELQIKQLIENEATAWRNVHILEKERQLQDKKIAEQKEIINKLERTLFELML